ncbi:hypothetical protein [Streptomyces sp. NPDC054940]
MLKGIVSRSDLLKDRELLGPRRRPDLDLDPPDDGWAVRPSGAAGNA